MLLNFTRHFYFKKGKFPAWIVAEASKEAEGSVVILFFLKRHENLTSALSWDWSVNKNLNSAAQELKNFAIAIVVLDYGQHGLVRLSWHMPQGSTQIVLVHKDV